MKELKTMTWEEEQEILDDLYKMGVDYDDAHWMLRMVRNHPADFEKVLKELMK